MKLARNSSNATSLDDPHCEDLFHRTLTDAMNRRNDDELLAVLRNMDSTSILACLEFYNQAFANLIVQADSLGQKIDIFRRAVEKRMAIQSSHAAKS